MANKCEYWRRFHGNEIVSGYLALQGEAESRKAIAEAERAELLARLPPFTSRPLPGAVDTGPFGAAGLVKAFDLAQQLAGDVCATLPAHTRTYDKRLGKCVHWLPSSGSIQTESP